MPEESASARKPSRFSIFRTWLGVCSTNASAWVSGWNDRIAQKLKTSRERVFQVELGGLLAFGFTMMQIGEWAVAVGCWVLLACILFAKTIAWEGVKGEQGATFLGRIAFILLILVGYTLLITITDLRKPDNEPWSNLQKWNWPEHNPPCSISVDVSSAIIARVHTRAMWLPTGQTEVYKPVFQDLFHDWVIKVTPTRPAAQVVISIKDSRRPIDNIKTDPSEGSVIKEPKPGWLSGFDEPTQTPDFYVRNVDYAELSKPVTITIRKPIKSVNGINTITNLDLDLDRNVNVAAEGCKVVFTPTSLHNQPLSAANAHFQELTEQLRAMVAQIVVGPVVTRLNPDEPYPPLAVNESEAVDELRCNSSPCKTMLLEMKEHTRIQ